MQQGANKLQGSLVNYVLIDEEGPIVGVGGSGVGTTIGCTNPAQQSKVSLLHFVFTLLDNICMEWLFSF
jgi:hypothetical protein